MINLCFKHVVNRNKQTNKQTKHCSPKHWIYLKASVSTVYCIFFFFYTFLKVQFRYSRCPALYNDQALWLWNSYFKISLYLLIFWFCMPLLTVGRIINTAKYNSLCVACVADALNLQWFSRVRGPAATQAISVEISALLQFILYMSSWLLFVRSTWGNTKYPKFTENYPTFLLVQLNSHVRILID